MKDIDHIDPKRFLTPLYIICPFQNYSWFGYGLNVISMEDMDLLSVSSPNYRMCYRYATQ